MPSSVSPTRIAAATTAVGILIASAISASAASMPSPGQAHVSILDDDVAVTVPDLTVASDDFGGCSNQLDGWTDSHGNEWTNHWGGWQCLGGGLVRSQFRLPLAHASMDIGRSDDIIISTRLDRISTQNNRSGPGLALFTDAFFHMYVIYERDAGLVTLGKWSPWANTTLQSVSIADRDSATISVIVDQPDLTVQVDGASIMSFDLGQLTPDEQSYFLNLTRFGLEADLDNWSRFGSFEVQVIP